MSDWQIGDLAVKVGGCCSLIPKGTVCLVVEICPLHDDGIGLVLEGWLDESGDEVCECFDPQNFRKIRPDEQEACEPEFITLLKRSKVAA